MTPTDRATCECGRSASAASGAGPAGPRCVGAPESATEGRRIGLTWKTGG